MRTFGDINIFSKPKFMNCDVTTVLVHWSSNPQRPKNMPQQMLELTNHLMPMNQAHFCHGGIYSHAFSADLIAGFSELALKSLQKTLVLYFTWVLCPENCDQNATVGVRLVGVRLLSAIMH